MRAGVMSFLVYFFVLLVAATSVLFGLDWMQAPLRPPVQSERTIQTVTAPPAPAPAQTTATAQPQTAASPAVAAPAPAQPTDGVKAEASEPKPAPLCDVDACERAYRSFTAIDCTYQPSSGPRRLCTRGNPRKPSAQLASGEAHAQSSCNVAACASAHSSFDAATCTYQTFAGIRRLCTK